MRGNVHFSVPSKRFELLGDSKESLTTYTSGTQTSKHTFCKDSGIISFYRSRVKSGWCLCYVQSIPTARSDLIKIEKQSYGSKIR
ncbi:hypothetical protein ACOSP7_026355 [Xanthoceras sorbifolium]